MNIKKKIVLGLCLCVSVICFTACGKKAVEYNTEEMNTGEEEGSLLETGVGIPEHVKEEITTGTGIIKVDADVINAENFGKLPVATMAIRDWSEDDIKNYAEAVFDKGSAEVILPYGRRDIKTLLKDQAEVEACIKDLGYTTETIFNSPEYMYLGSMLLDIRQWINNYTDSNVVENDGSYQWIRTEYEDGEMRLTCQIKGMIDGREYGMYFHKDTSQNCAMMTLFQIGGRNYAEMNRGTAEIDAERLARDSPIFTDNICTLSEQEAVKQVQNLVSQLGINDFAVTGVYQARQYVETYDEDTGMSTDAVTKGYLVYLGRMMNGCTTPCIVPYQQNSCWYGQEVNGAYETQITYGYEGIMALVTDDGIEDFRYLNPMDVLDIETEQALMTDFESIHQIALNYMKQIDLKHEINNIRLCMGRVCYDNSYVLIPVWCYEYDIGVSDIIAYPHAVLVNAIDGTIVNADSGEMVQN